MPLLEILIFERKNWGEEVIKNENKMVESLNKANEKIKNLENELEKKPLVGISLNELQQNHIGFFYIKNLFFFFKKILKK
jgi:hypothetical protein